MADIDSGVVEAQSRAQDYWFSDGLDALLSSAFVALLGGIGFIPNPSLWKAVVVVGLASVVCYLFLAKRVALLGWLKSKITYPRSGYASIERGKLLQEDSRRYPEIVVMIFSASLFQIDPPWIGLIALAAGLGFLWGRYGFSLLVPGIALSGILVATLSPPHGHRMYWLYIALGILYFIKGTAQLLKYLLKHPAPQA